nr:zinc ribbon domain-containing protein [Caldisphaera lagunensis]
MWSYSKLFKALLLKAQDYGIKVLKVIEYNTSRVCAFHNVEVERKPQGIITCKMGHKLHSDLNGAINIMKKAIGKMVKEVKKPLSFFVDHNRVAPIKESNT